MFFNDSHTGFSSRFYSMFPQRWRLSWRANTGLNIYIRLYNRTSLMSSSVLLQYVFVCSSFYLNNFNEKHSWSTAAIFGGFTSRDFSKSFIGYFCSNQLTYLSMQFVRVQNVQPDSSTDTITAWKSSSSSSCCAIGTDNLDPLRPHFSIVHCFL